MVTRLQVIRTSLAKPEMARKLDVRAATLNECARQENISDEALFLGNLEISHVVEPRSSDQEQTVQEIASAIALAVLKRADLFHRAKPGERVLILTDEEVDWIRTLVHAAQDEVEFLVDRAPTFVSFLASLEKKLK